MKSESMTGKPVPRIGEVLTGTVREVTHGLMRAFDMTTHQIDVRDSPHGALVRISSPSLA